MTPAHITPQTPTVSRHTGSYELDTGAVGAAVLVMPTLSDATVQEMYAQMLGARVFSQRLFNLQRQGRAGTNAPVDGNEAVIVGASFALDPEKDWVLPQYRELVGLERFGPEVLDRYVLFTLGHPDGGHIPEPVRVWPPQISLATQIPHAVGLAWGLQREAQIADQPLDGCVLGFIGDGASSEGDFYEAANFAAVLDAPVIILLVNNGWAISTPVSSQTRAKNFAEKSHAFGMPGVTVDGTDALAVREAVADARARAVAGAGPTLIEAVTYRLAPHTTADDPTRYVPADELADARKRDPLTVMKRELENRNLWTEEWEARTLQEADERMEAAVVAGEARPLDPASLFDHVYDEMTPRMVRQRAGFVNGR